MPLVACGKPLQHFRKQRKIVVYCNLLTFTTQHWIPFEKFCQNQIYALTMRVAFLLATTQASFLLIITITIAHFITSIIKLSSCTFQSTRLIGQKVARNTIRHRNFHHTKYNITTKGTESGTRRKWKVLW